jgi:hypothetical protein
MTTHSTTPIDDMDDEYRQGDNCIMCRDEKHFSTITLQTLLFPIHHEGAVQMANQSALTRSAQDSRSGCSLSREELFVFHFAKAYPIHLATLQKDACAKFNEECYARMETDPEYRGQCCYYHLDGLHCVQMMRDSLTTATTTDEWGNTPGTY